MRKIFLLFACLILSMRLYSQEIKAQKMKDLSFMVGEWIGTSSTYKEGVVTKQVSAFQRINYDLDESIIVIRLNSETLKLHTIVFYDEEESTYYYYPFSERGVRPKRAELKDGKLVVQANEITRYVFERQDSSRFREYGERLVHGTWEKYFEDNFINSQ